jgi:hypothetical protein
LNKEELIFKIKGTGCKMLDGVHFDSMNMEEVCRYLKKSCCPALKELIKQAEKSLH